jgi:hypothetical protein
MPSDKGLCGKIESVPSFETCSIYLPYNGEPASSRTIFREKNIGEWQNAFMLVKIASDKMFRGSIVNLKENTEYEIRIQALDRDGNVVGYAEERFKTWTSDAPVGKTVKIKDIMSDDALVIKAQRGSADGWIKYVGEKDLTLKGNRSLDSAVIVENSSFIILEGVEIRGGRNHGINVVNSNDVRIINCDISGYGRVGKQDFSKDGKFYDEKGKAIHGDSGVFVNYSKNVVIERCYIHDPRGKTNTWYYSHPAGPDPILIQSLGGTVIRYCDFIGSDQHGWMDGVESTENGMPDGGFNRDGDIYGNFFAFGNDDGFELDGGQMNVRAYGNKIEGFLCGISTAANLRGPSYIYRNIIVNLRDEYGRVGSVIKNGGGSTYSKGISFFFNNTFVTDGSGIDGVGFGYDEDRVLYKGVSRNNIIECTGAPISDACKIPETDFDYDMLFNYGNMEPFCAKDGAEKHGIIGAPAFVNKENCDLRLVQGSPGVDAGTVIDNFTSEFAGSSPDIGAFEHGRTSLIPYRPVPLQPEKTQINLVYSISGQIPSDKLTVKCISDGEYSKRFTVVANEDFKWIDVKPVSGTFRNGQSIDFTVSIDKNYIRGTGLHRGVFLIRLENGYSVPVTCYAKVFGGIFSKTLDAKLFPGSESYKKIPDAEASGGECLLSEKDKNSDKYLGLSVDIPKTADYYLFARIKCPAPIGEHDSFKISINGGSYIAAHLKGGADWHWSPVSTEYGKGGLCNIKLSKGTHKIKIAPRESLFLDTFIVTSDPLLPGSVK